MSTGANPTDTPWPRLSNLASFMITGRCQRGATFIRARGRKYWRSELELQRCYNTVIPLRARSHQALAKYQAQLGRGQGRSREAESCRLGLPVK